jgi:hypothetical protein
VPEYECAPPSKVEEEEETAAAAAEKVRIKGSEDTGAKVLRAERGRAARENNMLVGKMAKRMKDYT